jgi:hypothetical protein
MQVMFKSTSTQLIVVGVLAVMGKTLHSILGDAA